MKNLWLCIVIIVFMAIVYSAQMAYQSLNFRMESVCYQNGIVVYHAFVPKEEKVDYFVKADGDWYIHERVTDTGVEYIGRFQGLCYQRNETIGMMYEPAPDSKGHIQYAE